MESIKNKNLPQTLHFFMALNQTRSQKPLLITINWVSFAIDFCLARLWNSTCLRQKCYQSGNGYNNNKYEAIYCTEKEENACYHVKSSE